MAFYMSLETPAQVEDREDCLGAIMTWDMGIDLRWVSSKLPPGS